FSLLCDDGRVQRDGHRNRIRQRNPMFTGLLEVGFLGAAIAFNGEARLRSTKAEHVLDVVRIQGGFTTTKMPAHELYRKSAAKNDSRGFGIAPDVVLGGGRHVAFATRGAAHHNAAADSRADAGIALHSWSNIGQRSEGNQDEAGV